ncbi:MAG: D-glycero-beta-D-manno-heptose-7-phosphate kinase [Proteobacteria bacterium]|nr:D-glycero-beta-D-manno-heptose-7-phosphate kinase [Pseudomonadota bacterium]
MDISKFDRCHILVVGDLMLDEYVWGEVDRVSPEAPVQILTVKSEDYVPGGAGNVVNNIAALGANVSVAGVVGGGANGQLLIRKFNQLGVDTSGIVQEPDRPTTRKTRIIAANQHLLRIDRETRKIISEATFSRLAGFIENKIASVDIILISDYGKGLVTENLIARITACARKHKKLTVADPKGLDFSKYSGVSLLTPNKKEAGLATGIEIVDDATLAQAADKILQTVVIDKLLITCGKDGMVFFERNRTPHKIHAEARQIYDVSGAGDTVLAVVGLALAAGESFENGITLANSAAGIVVQKVGTATISRKELAAAMRPWTYAAEYKHKQLSELPALTRELRRKGKRIVMTNGCFDLLHTGHILLFSESKKLGDALIVAIDDDESVRALKGPGRPVISAGERVRIISALDSVDYVVVFASKELQTLIETIRPDVLTKGSNYTSDTVLGRSLVERLGGQVVLVPVTDNISSTRIINNIRTGDSAAT